MDESLDQQVAHRFEGREGRPFGLDKEGQGSHDAVGTLQRGERREEYAAGLVIELSYEPTGAACLWIPKSILHLPEEIDGRREPP